MSRNSRELITTVSVPIYALTLRLARSVLQYTEQSGTTNTVEINSDGNVYVLWCRYTIQQSKRLRNGVRIRTKTADRTAKVAVQTPLLTANMVRRCKTSAVLAEQVSANYMIGISRLLFQHRCAGSLAYE